MITFYSIYSFPFAAISLLASPPWSAIEMTIWCYRCLELHARIDFFSELIGRSLHRIEWKFLLTLLLMLDRSPTPLPPPPIPHLHSSWIEVPLDLVQIVFNCFWLSWRCILYHPYLPLFNNELRKHAILLWDYNWSSKCTLWGGHFAFAYIVQYRNIIDAENV